MWVCRPEVYSRVKAQRHTGFGQLEAFLMRMCCKVSGGKFERTLYMTSISIASSCTEDLLTLARMIGKKDTRHMASNRRSETLIASNLLLKRNLCHIRVLLTGCLPVCMVIRCGLMFKAFPRWQVSTKKRARLTKCWESTTILYTFSTSSASASCAKTHFKLPHSIAYSL